MKFDLEAYRRAQAGGKSPEDELNDMMPYDSLSDRPTLEEGDRSPASADLFPNQDLKGSMMNRLGDQPPRGASNYKDIQSTLENNYPTASYSDDLGALGNGAGQDTGSFEYQMTHLPKFRQPQPQKSPVKRSSNYTESVIPGVHRVEFDSDQGLESKPFLRAEASPLPKKANPMIAKVIQKRQSPPAPPESQMPGMVVPSSQDFAPIPKAPSTIDRAPSSEEGDDYRGYQGTQNNSDYIINLAQAMQPAMRAQREPLGNDALYSNMNAQNTRRAGLMNSELERRYKIAQAIEQRKSQQTIAQQKNDALLKTGDLNRQNRLDAAKISAGGQSQRATDRNQDKDQQRTTQRFDQLNKHLTSEIASGRTTFGIASRNVQAVQNAEALLAGEKNLNDLDSRQVYEAVRVLDRITSQGSPTIAGTEHLDPSTVYSKAQRKLEQITNSRQGAGAGDFVKNIQHTLEREKDQANQQILETQKKLMSTSGDLQKKDPEKWESMMSAHHLTPFGSQQAGIQGAPTFPMKVKKGNTTATVSNAQELAEAQAEGFK